MTQTDKAPGGEANGISRAHLEKLLATGRDFERSGRLDRWSISGELAILVVLAALREGDKDFVRVPRERYDLVRSLAQRGADKAGCDGWRAQEMCRQVANLLPAPSNK